MLNRIVGRRNGHRNPNFGGLGGRLKALAPLLAAPAALLLGQGEAKAVLTYNIFESGGDVIVQTSGSLNLTGASVIGFGLCGVNGGIRSSDAIICTGPNAFLDQYSITGPLSFDGTANIFPSSSVSGIISSSLAGYEASMYIDQSYTSGAPFVSSATFNGQSLALLGFTTTGLIGTWTLDGTSESINVVIGAPSPAAVPGPLPLLGAGAAFGWSRRLRRRITTPLSQQSQA